jgi:hypothetical protein
MHHHRSFSISICDVYIAQSALSSIHPIYFFILNPLKCGIIFQPKPQHTKNVLKITLKSKEQKPIIADEKIFDRS